MSTSDMELLEMAAKSSGNWPRLSHGCWNPLEDDGDALRLAVDTHISIEPFGTHILSYVDLMRGSFREACDDSAASRRAATRRAIVCAAASMGASK